MIATAERPDIVSQYHIEPIGARVVVQRFEDSKETKSGIIIPENAKQKKHHRGWVRAVGPGLKDTEGNRVPMEVAVGDFVIFNHFANAEFDVGGTTYVVMNEDDILGIVKKRKVRIDPSTGKELELLEEEKYDSIPGKKMESVND